MNKVKPEIINKCSNLRSNGYSLGEISSNTGLAKSTVHAYVKNIKLKPQQIIDIDTRRKEKSRLEPNPRKGKALSGRAIIKPKKWSIDLIHFISHVMFDGRVDDDGCIYYSKCKFQINHMKRLLYKLFKARPKIQLRDNGVYGLIFYHVEFASYIKNRKSELISYLNNGASDLERKTFLKSFFDDEGNVFYKGDKRRVRGYQKSRYILEQIRNLLRGFGIKSRIDRKGTELEISGQSNLLKFAKEINFSHGIYINPERKNGIWKERISKHKILNSLLNSYLKK